MGHIPEVFGLLIKNAEKSFEMPTKHCESYGIMIKIKNERGIYGRRKTICIIN